MVLSFTIIASLATVATLVVALLLYDRFGVSSKFKEKQIEKILELVEYLNNSGLYISTGKLRYTNILRKWALTDLSGTFPPYDIDKRKILLFAKKYDSDFLSKVFDLLNHHWFPVELKEKAVVFNILGFKSVDNSDDDKYVRLDINNEKDSEFWESIPSMTFEMYGINLSNFIVDIETWLNNHSDIKIGFRLFNDFSFKEKD